MRWSGMQGKLNLVSTIDPATRTSQLYDSTFSTSGTQDAEFKGHDRAVLC
jgi:hypothetical protein